MYLRPCISQESVERKHAHVLKRYMIFQYPCRSDLERCSPAAIRTYVSVVVRCSRAGKKMNGTTVYSCIDKVYRRYFQHAHFIPIVGVGKRGEY